MKAIAQQIGSSQKERVLVDGEEFLKSVKIGRWTHIVKLTIESLDGEGSVSRLGKSASLKSANSWQPFELFQESYLIPGAAHSQERIQKHEEFVKKYSNRGKWITARGHGFKYKTFRVPLNVKREVVEIEREST